MFIELYLTDGQGSGQASTIYSNGWGGDADSSGGSPVCPRKGLGLEETERLWGEEHTRGGAPQRPGAVLLKLGCTRAPLGTLLL